MLFRENKGELKPIKQTNFALEKSLQTLVESNLKILFGLQVLESEFSLSGFRFDSVAFDEENRAFVIIEYKRGKNESLVDQGYAYLHTLLDRKADMVLLYNEKTGKTKTTKDFDWAATRIYFVSQCFTAYQKAATGYCDMPFRLFEAEKYGDLIFFREVIQNKSVGNFSELSGDSDVRAVSREVRVYTEEEHLEKGQESIKEIYLDFKERMSEFTGIRIEPKKIYIAFKNGQKTICSVEFFKNSLKVFINAREGEMEDSAHRARSVRGIGHHGMGDYEVSLSDKSELDYLMTLLRQVYLKSFDS